MSICGGSGMGRQQEMPYTTYCTTSHSNTLCNHVTHTQKHCCIFVMFVCFHFATLYWVLYVYITISTAALTQYTFFGIQSSAAHRGPTLERDIHGEPDGCLDATAPFVQLRRQRGCSQSSQRDALV